MADDVAIISAVRSLAYSNNISLSNKPVIKGGILVQFGTGSPDAVSEDRSDNDSIETLHLDPKFEFAALKWE